MKTHLAPIVLALLGALPLAWTTGQAAGDPPENPPAPVTVIAVRHAEKGTADPRDPALSEAGQARAEELARLIAKAGVTHLFATPYVRTRQTLAPLAEAMALEVEPYSPADMPAFLAKLRALPAGAVAVVAGHSNTTPGVVLGLGGQIDGLGTYQGAPALGDDEYDRLFVVTLGDETRVTKSLELHFGAKASR